MQIVAELIFKLLLELNLEMLASRVKRVDNLFYWIGSTDRNTVLSPVRWIKFMMNS